MNTDDDSQSKLGGDNNPNSGVCETNDSNNDLVNIKIDINMNVNIDINMNETNTVNEPNIDDTVVDEPNIDIEFTTKRDLYDYYGIDVKTIPDGYEVKMS